jgi:hypothetical protein
MISGVELPKEKLPLKMAVSTSSRKLETYTPHKLRT